MVTPEQVCMEYERLAVEVARLTLAIGEERCPEQSIEYSQESCFHNSSREHINIDGHHYEDEPNTKLRTLDEIQEDVKGCRSCHRLCGLIRERRAARRKFGAAKRSVRAVGKRLKGAL